MSKENIWEWQSINVNTYPTSVALRFLGFVFSFLCGFVSPSSKTSSGRLNLFPLSDRLYRKRRIPYLLTCWTDKKF